MKIFKYMALALAAVMTMSCVKEQFEVDQNKVPSASDLQVKIDVDQATNYVTFSIENEGMVPMWLFGEEKIDGKANKKYSYTGSGLQLRFRDAGTHSVEVKAYNAHGVSVGSKVVEFTLENTYRDPFDPSKYITFFAGSESKTWEWNSTVKGHFGCGEPGTDGTNWWSAGPDEKKDMGLYDDRLTFTKDMKYTYNPGEGGTVYVNWGMAAAGYHADCYNNDEQDYQVPIEAFTTTYSFENAWNDAGIEEIYLVLPENTNLSYIPNVEAMAEPRFKLLEGTNTKKLALVHDNGAIAWKYEFIVEGSAQPDTPAPGPGEVVFDPNSDRNMWKNAVTTDHHFYFANNDWGAIDNATVTSDGGTHTFVLPEGLGTQQWQGQFFFQNTGLATSAAKTYDFYLVMNSTADHPGMTVKLCAQDDDAAIITDGRYALTAFEDYVLKVVAAPGIDCENLKLVFDFGGGQGGSSVVVKDIILQEHIDAGGPAPFDPSAADNLWNAAVTTDHHFYFANNDWGAIENATVTSDGGTHTFVLPEGLGTQQWQGQFFFQNTGLKSEAAKTYDFHLVLNSTADHPGVTVKLCSQTDDGAIITDGRYALTAYEDFVLDVYAAPGIDCDNLKLVLDFGGGQGGSIVVVKDIVFREAKTVGGGGSSEPTFDPTDASNMWLTANTTEMTYYYAPGWSQIDDPGFVADGNNYTVTLPEATTDQWQAQVAFANTGMAATSDKTYDFYLVMNSTQDHPGVTVKLTQDGDDNLFFFADRHQLTAYEDYVYKVVAMPGIDASNLKLVLDFGGNAAGTEVTIKDIIFRESQSTPAPEPEKPAPLDPNSDANLWKTANTSNVSFWFANNDWAQIDNPEFTAGDNEYTLIMPEGIGTLQWQGQFVFNNTGIVTTPDKTYDFQVTLYSEADHPHVTVKPCYEQAPSNDVNELFIKSDIALAAYEEYVYTVTGLTGTDIPDLKMVFDFGGAVSGSKVVISGITLIEH